MKRTLVVTLIALLLGVASAFALQSTQHPKPTLPIQTERRIAAVPVHSPTRAELLQLVNAERARNNVAPLTEDPRLDQSAQLKADDEVTYHYIGHISPDSSPYAGMHGFKLIDKVGVSCVYEGENLTENNIVNDSQHAITAWINSPPHHAAMINPRYSLTGFGIENDQIVEHFCQQ